MTEISYRGQTENIATSNDTPPNGPVFATGTPIKGWHTVVVVAGSPITYSVYAAEKYNGRWVAREFLGFVTGHNPDDAVRRAAETF